MNKDSHLIFEAYRKRLIKEADTTAQAPAQPAPAQTQQLSPEQIEAKLMAAFKAGPGAVKEYLNSTEGRSDAVRNILKSGIKSNEDVVRISAPEYADVKSLVPTQNFIDLMQSVAWPLSQVGQLAKVIKKGTTSAEGSIVKDGNLIIDGHHRWSGVFAILPDTGKVSAINATWPGVNTKEKLAAAQIAIAAKLKPGQPLPSAGGEVETNILGKSAKEIADMVMANINKKKDPNVPDSLLNDKMIQELITNKNDGDVKLVSQWAGIDAQANDPQVIRQAIANKIGANLSRIKSNDQAPPREDMPQFDAKKGGVEFPDMETDLQQGDLNIAPPFKPGTQKNVQ